MASALGQYSPLDTSVCLCRPLSMLARLIDGCLPQSVQYITLTHAMMHYTLTSARTASSVRFYVEKNKI